MMVPLARLELATQGLGIPCSIHTELQGQFFLRHKYNLTRFIFQQNSPALVSLKVYF